MKTIYVTHCSRDKNPDFERSGESVTPDLLYTSPGLQSFIKYCRENSRDWAIFSDRYGVVFSSERIAWYSKPPDTVTPQEFELLMKSFTERLSEFDKIIFYHRPSETHPLFQRIVQLGRESGMYILEFAVSELD